MTATTSGNVAPGRLSLVRVSLLTVLPEQMF